MLTSSHVNVDSRCQCWQHHMPVLTASHANIDSTICKCWQHHMPVLTAPHASIDSTTCQYWQHHMPMLTAPHTSVDSRSRHSPCHCVYRDRRGSVPGSSAASQRKGSRERCPLARCGSRACRVVVDSHSAAPVCLASPSCHKINNHDALVLQLTAW